jgi:hypothetical protein
VRELLPSIQEALGLISAELSPTQNKNKSEQQFSLWSSDQGDNEYLLTEQMD